MKSIALAVITLGLAGLCASTVQAQVNTTNLLTNPGAETGNLTGWTVGGVSNPNVDNGSFNAGINPNTGAFDFYGNNGPNGSLTQSVSLVGNQGITALLIDSGVLTANVVFFEQGLNQGTPSDDAQISLDFLDAGNAVIGTVLTPEVDSHNLTWEQSASFFAIPVGARTINYTMLFIRHVGSDNDSYVDDNSLTISGGIQVTPEPGSVALLAGMGLSGAGFLIRRRARK